MKTISKALIAVMAAAAMCLVPLFAIADDSDAADIKPGEVGLSFEGSDVPVDKFNQLIRSEYVTGLLMYSIGIVPITSEPSVTKVTSLKTAMSVKVSDGSSEYYSGQSAIVEFVAEGDLYADYTLFNCNDGLQELYKYMGSTNKIASGTHIKVEGTVEFYQYGSQTEDFYKTDAGKIAPTKTVGEMTMKSVSDLKWTFKVAGADKEVSVKDTSITVDKATSTFDYDTDDKAKVVDGTKVYVTTVNDDKSSVDEEYSFDGKSASYSNKEVTDDSAKFSYRNAGDYLSGTDAEAPVIHYYSATDEPALFTDDVVPAGSTSIQNDNGMKSFLEGIGSVSDSYSDAKSISESASATIDMGNSGSGGNNLVFYIIIGVLAVAVVALAVILIKKK